MRFKTLLCLLLIVLLSACGGGKGNTRQEDAGGGRQVTTRGSAVIGPAGKDQARQVAIDAAINNASQQLKSSNASPVLVSDIKVVDEWQEGNVYHVQALAVLSDKPLCASPYRKKIVATAFPLMNPDQISGTESQDLYSGIPREISNRLMESGGFIARNLTNTMLYTRPDMAPEVSPVSGRSGTSVLLNIASQYDAQLVLSGVIRDFKIESGEYLRGSGALAQLKWATRDFVARRSVGIDVFVHDGFTGALVFQRRYTESIIGDISLPAGYNVGSERFESSNAGHKISEIIHQASDDIQSLFGCYPFSARVAQVDQNRITIAAGAQDKLKVGDRLMVYSAGFAHTAGMGFNESLGILTLTEVGPTMAAGSMQSSIGVVRPGDWVRSVASP